MKIKILLQKQTSPSTADGGVMEKGLFMISYSKVLVLQL